MRASDNAVLHGGEFDGETLLAAYDVRLELPSKSSPGAVRVYRDTGRFAEYKGFHLMRVFDYQEDDIDTPRNLKKS